MYKGLPFIVWFVLIALVGVEILSFAGLINVLYQSPLPVGELAVFGLLIGIIGLVLLGAIWLFYNRRNLPNVPLNERTDSDYPATKKGVPSPKTQVSPGTQPVN